MNLHKKHFLIGLLLFNWLLLPATTFMVTDNGNDGPGTLRQAIEDANNDLSATIANPHIIQFNLMAPPPCVITINERIGIENWIDIQGTGMDVLIIEMSGLDR